MNPWLDKAASYAIVSAWALLLGVLTGHALAQFWHFLPTLGLI